MSTKTIPNGWRNVSLGDVATIKGGKRLPLGTALQPYKNSHPYIKATNLTGNVVSGVDEYVPDEVYLQIKRYIVDAGNIVLSIVGTVGLVARVPEYLDKANLTENCVKIETDATLVDPDFLFHFLASTLGQAQIRTNTVGAVQAKLPIYGVQNISVSLPPLPEQKSIAAVLSSLDDKIELLRAENETLEAIAQEVFNEWFVKPTAGGVLPEGWKMLPLNSIFTFEGGAQPPKSEHIYEPRDGYVRFIQNRDYSTDAHPTYIRESYKNRLCDELDIMMDKYGEVGTVRYGIVGAYNVALAKIEPSTPNTREYLRSFFSQTHIRELLDASAVASTRGSLNKTTFAGLDIPLPMAKTLENYENTALLLRRQVLYNRAQSRHLAIVRDTLLPKLMSGKIRV